MHQADSANSSMVLCVAFPSGQKEGTISGACFLKGGHRGTGTVPTCLPTQGSAGFRPEPLKEDRDLVTGAGSYCQSAL